MGLNGLVPDFKFPSHNANTIMMAVSEEEEVILTVTDVSSIPEVKWDTIKQSNI